MSEIDAAAAGQVNARQASGDQISGDQISDDQISGEWASGHRRDASAASLPWLFSPAVDLAAFLGSALIALGLLAIGAPLGWLDNDTPEWMWIVAILMIDVAHVYSTGFRVYFDPAQLRRRPWLYGLTPILAFAIGSAVYSESPLGFWRGLAYLAVFHFVRQQYGWIALYRRREGDRWPIGWWVDTVAIYMATVYPLIHWHTQLPRRFHWFMDGDFAALPQMVATIALPIYWIAMAAYVGRSVYRGVVLGQFNPGKDVVLVTTAVCWYIGIITFNSDYAFTVTNVIIHGVPYMVLVYWQGVLGRPERRGGHLRYIVPFLGVVWVLAYVEELIWDISLWHQRPWLFGVTLDLQWMHYALVPLLAVPQMTHYVLDGFIWRRRGDRPRCDSDRCLKVH